MFHFRQVEFESILNDNSSDEEESSNRNITMFELNNTGQRQHSSTTQIDNFTDRDEVVFTKITN